MLVGLCTFLFYTRLLLFAQVKAFLYVPELTIVSPTKTTCSAHASWPKPTNQTTNHGLRNVPTLATAL